MAAQRQYRYFTPEEYLAAEDKADTKSEYYDGVIVAMSGASPEHNKITFDVIGELMPQCGAATVTDLPVTYVCGSLSATLSFIPMFLLPAKSRATKPLGVYARCSIPR